jgi:oxaloacetate decarboxylase gamma subunit
MTITEMLGQSAILTLLGMGVVFTFLIILIFFISLTSKIIKGLKLDEESSKTADATGAATAAKSNAVIAAIAAAVREKQNN